MHSDSKKRRSFLALLFAAGDVKQRYELISLPFCNLTDDPATIIITIIMQTNLNEVRLWVK